jgi:hypothetical protein
VLFFASFPVVTMYKSMYIKNPATFISINSGLTYLVSDASIIFLGYI